MASLVQLLNDWEIQFLVIVSFVLQIFLFFSGGLRRRSTSILKLFIWLAYLLADSVAIYALGILSRHENDTSGTHQLAFFWTPFLLIHLGGQDTITAFSVEDNELWLRHLLNLLVQVYLALYVFWKSAVHKQLLVPAIFIFLAGIIKYGERTCALKRASQKITDEQSLPRLRRLPKVNDSDVSYSGIVTRAVRAMLGVRDLFDGKKLDQMKPNTWKAFTRDPLPGDDIKKEFKMLEIELGMMYDDIYTKSMVFRTWTGAVLRCATQIAMIVAFALFLVSGTQRYSRADVAITYALFVGSFCLEVCAEYMLVLSPWTWAFLKSRKCHRLAQLSWHILECVRPEKRPLWSNSMGQYNLLSACLSDKSRSMLVSRIAIAIGVEKLWRNWRHTKHAEASMEIMALVMRRLRSTDQHMPKLGPSLEDTLRMPFEHAILVLHLFTDLRLSAYRDSNCHITDEASRLIDVCEKASNYMLYLVVVQPFILPVSGSVEAILEEISSMVRNSKYNSKKDVLDGLDEPIHFGEAVYERAVSFFKGTELLEFQETLPEIAEMWLRILVYAAGKSHAAVHAKQLSAGGELLTFIWLLMAHWGAGDVGKEIELVSPSKETHVVIFPRYAFNFLGGEM